ncbi:hypothetical protein G9444_0329 [Rhodococcus erythropolis]|uniref:DUF3987 domain-containing protein n=1 Tax=Rhodococcus erythropolis TaxID=1833 RepID=A0A6G9CKL9_RHOER|nr:hypothetical protein [Rhodococcus erythropolis]QIP37573.1 hypothetical protein G9444_0329 [Rhodococcus erythropolis]
MPEIGSAHRWEGRVTTDEFFDATPELQIIRQWARARYAAEWAVFGGVLLRVAATTGPEVQLPGVIGGRASLNLLCAFVAPSGGGKGISDKVARLAWPAPIVERPIGSGEGIAATFVPPKKEGIEPITKAIINVPEIDTLAGIASRQGSILLAQLKSAAMGEQLGQANSSEATTRIVPPHTYRLCMSVGAQPAHTGVLFNDTTGGTPQRFLWFLTTDPDMPADVTPDPEPLNSRLPLWRPDAGGVIEIVYGPPEITETIIGAHIARQRGQEDALDGHAMLTRLKVAACLAILHHRGVVSELDWQLSGVVMEVSNRTRDWVVAESRKADRRKIRDRAIGRAVGEEFIADRKLDRAKAAVMRWLDQHEELPMSDLRKRARSDWRDQVSAAVTELVDSGAVVEIEVDRGHRYRLIEGVHGGRGSTLENPSSETVDPGSTVDQIQASADTTHAATREFSAEPEFSTHISRSETLNQSSALNPEEGIHGDKTADSAISKTPLHAVADPTPPTMTARQWIDAHVSKILNGGENTVESLEVYAAGQAAGYKLDNLRQAAKSSGLISVAARKGSVTIWNLGAGGQNTVVSAEEWLTGWLRSTGGWVKAADVYAAGLAAGYGRDTVKSASVRAKVDKRGQSISTEWSVAPAVVERGA